MLGLKEHYPVETAEYATAQGINQELEFNWWVPHVLEKWDRIILAVKQRNACYLKCTQKYGIELLKSIDEAYKLDKKNGNTYWADADGSMFGIQDIGGW